MVHYRVVLPANFDPAKPYSGILAFDGRPETMNIVEGTLTRDWRESRFSRIYSNDLCGQL